MNIDTIIELLKNSGFYGVRADASYVYVENPSCVLRSFDIFLHYAWIVVIAITGFLLVGWGISMIRGIKNDLTSNLRNLLVIFFALFITKPILNFIYGGDIFASGCDTIRISRSEVNRLLDARNDRLGNSNDEEFYEIINIYDSNENYYQTPIHNQPYYDAPLSGSGTP